MSAEKKYEPFRRWLAAFDGDHITLSIDYIEQIIDASLPPSIMYDALWRGRTPGRPGGAIADAGWRVEAIHHTRRSITLARVAGTRGYSSAEPSRPVVEAVDATVVVTRMDRGPRLVIQRAELLAWDFFTTDASSIGPDAYDARVGRGELNRITTSDILAINTTMRARSPHSAWATLTDAGELEWLIAIPMEANLFTISDTGWARLRPAVERAFAESIQPYRNTSVATKVLHLKRPSLFPVLDSLVAQQIGGVGRTPMQLLDHVRQVGRLNVNELSRIRTALARVGLERTEVRILDALLWTSHPAAGLAAALRRWERTMSPA